MSNLLEDKSDSKHSSHLKLKSLVYNTGKSCLQNFTKKDLLQLCFAYGIKVSTSAKKDDIKNLLCSALTSPDKMNYRQHLK